MKILVYFPSNARAVDQQSVMELLCNMGHEVFLLTWQLPGDLHRNVAEYCVRTDAVGLDSNSGLISYLKHSLFLRRYVSTHNIDVVFAHLESPGLVASVTRWFSSFKLFYFRHSTDAHKVDGNLNARVGNYLCNLLAPHIVAVSRATYEYLVEVERISPSKVTLISYAFNFSQYLRTDFTGSSRHIRDSYQCQLLLSCVGRLVPLKRHLEMFEVVKRLKELGVDVKLICLGEGALRGRLANYISDNNLENNIWLLGNKKNVLDYIEASDALLHLSETESLGMVVLEAGLVKRSVVVCKEVGVFEDFVSHDENGFLVSKEDPVEEAVSLVLQVDRRKLLMMGEELYATVHSKFGVGQVASLYRRLLEPK